MRLNDPELLVTIAALRERVRRDPTRPAVLALEKLRMAAWIRDLDVDEPRILGTAGLDEDGEED